MRAYICMYKYMHDLLHPCQVWSYFWALVQTYDSLCQWLHTIVLMSCYLFRSLYILCTACRILAYRLMFFVYIRLEIKLILSYLISSHLISSHLILSYHNHKMCILFVVGKVTPTPKYQLAQKMSYGGQYLLFNCCTTQIEHKLNTKHKI